jgi:hypothetical protein
MKMVIPKLGNGHCHSLQVSALGLGRVKTRRCHDGLEKDSAVTGLVFPRASGLLPGTASKMPENRTFRTQRAFLQPPSYPAKDLRKGSIRRRLGIGFYQFFDPCTFSHSLGHKQNKEVKPFGQLSCRCWTRKYLSRAA